MKRFSTVERFAELHEEEKREIEVITRRRGGIKRGESNLASNQIPMCSPQPRTPSKVHGVTERIEEGGRR